MANKSSKSSSTGGGKGAGGKHPSAKDKASAMRYASLHPDSDFATSGAAQRIQAAHDRNNPPGK
ncbi:hypothetical protein ABZ297_24075 [Nonomuraea sp. NPDC005983]|uniref:hypothetical protein n=1 Tax=Nonomuraea sp. NPDC005983 TaxID=3155595 RepID=UPI0033A79D59